MARLSESPIFNLAWQPAWLVPLSLLAVAAVFWPLLGLPAAFLCFLGWLALPRGAAPGARRSLIGASLLAGVALLRFVVVEAVPGIVEGGRRAAQDRAVSQLREVLFAQDAVRQSGWIDADRDGTGSAGLLVELCRGSTERADAVGITPVLRCGELVETSLGLAARIGPYLYTVCLPREGGSWSAQLTPPVAEEAAERRFIAYAWPAPGTPFERAFYLDEHENIGQVELGPPDPSASNDTRGITCDAAVGADRERRWTAWRGKRPRTSLPGDRAASPER